MKSEHTVASISSDGTILKLEIDKSETIYDFATKLAKENGTTPEAEHNFIKMVAAALANGMSVTRHVLPDGSIEMKVGKA